FTVEHAIAPEQVQVLDHEIVFDAHLSESRTAAVFGESAETYTQAARDTLASDVGVLHRDCPEIDRHRAREYVNELALAIARNASKSKNLTGVDGEVDPVEHVDTASSQAHVFDAQQRCSARDLCSLGSRTGFGSRVDGSEWRV